MNLETILTHMNDHHQKDMLLLISHFKKATPVDVRLVSIDSKGLDLEYSTTSEVQIKARIDFSKECAVSEMKDEIITLCKQAAKSAPKEDNDHSKIISEVIDFKHSFKSVVLATLNDDNTPVASYSPVFHINGKTYIYISSIAEHHSNLKANAKADVLYLQDENEAKNIALRKRLRYSAKALFIPRNSDVFNAVMNEGCKGDKTLSMIRGFSDFDLVELELGDGRFVKGFGAAYDIKKDGSVHHIGGNGGKAPHGMPHSKS